MGDARQGEDATSRNYFFEHSIFVFGAHGKEGEGVMEEGGSSSRTKAHQPKQAYTDALVAVVRYEHPLLQEIWDAIGIDAHNIEVEEETLREELVQLFKVLNIFIHFFFYLLSLIISY